ncbi:MAG: type II and III secretion system protein [Oceanospirillum sp.]|nr:type II and III secretion system protein [Oceanospirillum sp.]
MSTSFTPPRAISRTLIKSCALFVLCLSLPTVHAKNAVLKNIELHNTKEHQTEIILQLDKPPAKILTYQLDNPSRLVIDLLNTQNQLPQRYFHYNQAQVKTISGAQANGRTRLVLDLNAPTSFRSKVIKNQVRINLGDLQPSHQANSTVALTSSQTALSPRIQDIDFRRGKDNKGLLTLKLDQPDSAFMLRETAKGKLELKLANIYLPPALRRTLDVKDFSTPVQQIRVQQSRENTLLVLDLEGSYNYIAYQTGRQLTLEIKPVNEEDKNRERQKKFPYTGKKLTLNFQNIDIRAVLQIIAETTNLNLVTSDSVSGNVTLHLEQVPWDQALQLVMDSKGLASRRTGNVLLVAPAEELAERERQELKANLDTQELAELESEFIQIQYAKASEIATILNGVDNHGGLLSKRGRALVDERTNTILVQDVASSLLKIQSAIRKLDIPIQQVLIEARIVSARSNIGNELGIRWGGGSSAAIDTGIKTIGENGLTVDLGVRSGSSFNFNPSSGSFALGYADSSILVDMELAALASEGKGEIISQPKVITANKRKAIIRSGKQIPYREESSSGGTKIAFKDAVLSLEVTPQITPDAHIIMDLKIAQDALGNQEFDGAPAIDTSAIETQVLVNDGETIVLGGIYTSESIAQNFKVPLLGDLPLLGNLFKRSEKSQEKVELLIFITPRLIEDSVSLN